MRHGHDPETDQENLDTPEAAGTPEPAIRRRPWQRRRYQVAAAAGMAAAVGTGVALAQPAAPDHATAATGRTHRTAATPVRSPVRAPVATAAATPAVTSASPAPATSSAASSPAGQAAGGAVDQMAAKKAEADTAARSSVKVTEVGSLAKDHHSERIVSARADLTGQGELAWAADAGQPVGDARCTQNFRFANTGTVTRPTLLLCWRTSKNKTVYVLAVDNDHPPSMSSTVATIDRVWARMG